MDFLKRTWAQIDLDAIRHNYRLIRAAVRPESKILSVVKADAYGHGAIHVANCLQQQGTDWFGVSNLDEAVQLRRNGISKPILILSYTPPQEVRHLAQLNITQTVVGLSYAQELEDRARQAGVCIDVHVKVDTGMSRVGLMAQTQFEQQQTVDDVASICAMPHLHAKGIFTHFATADEQGDTFTVQQYQRFMQLIDALQQRGITFEIKHCCNSAATLLYPQLQLDMVRPGLILYGLLPASFMRQAGRWDLRAAMDLKTTVSLVKSVPQGTGFGYGQTYVADTPMKVATVAIGYADGFPRLVSGKGHMLVNGVSAPLVGRVSMDQCMLDVTAVEGIEAGDVVTVFGRDNGSCLSVEEVSEWAQTISYETVCLIGKRVPRIYIDAGKPVAAVNYIIPEQ